MKNHDFRLEPYERELLESYERDEWRSVAGSAGILHEYQTYAVATLEAMGLVSIALPPEDVSAIQKKAAARGISYQVLIAEIVHRYLKGELVEKAA